MPMPTEATRWGLAPGESREVHGKTYTNDGPGRLVLWWDGAGVHGQCVDGRCNVRVFEDMAYEGDD